METKLKIRPYARLLTMLGEQLITNEQIALAELIKNAYDADADWVKVCFVDFDYDIENNIIKALPQSKIIIEDNGCGMSLDVIKNSWMNPATPNKKSKDIRDVQRTPKKKRIIQGEKGIGRFAILKLGRDIKKTIYYGVCSFLCLIGCICGRADNAVLSIFIVYAVLPFFVLNNRRGLSRLVISIG